MLVPVKSFQRAKLRLAGALPAVERALLARAMATRVVHAAGALPVAVVCDDPGVAEWAADLGAVVVETPGHGLNRAVHTGVDLLAAAGARRVIVAHADLALAVELTWVARFDGVTLVPDRRDDGTNVLCLPTGGSFRFSYGPGSFRRHGHEARRLGLPVRVVREPLLGHDVDVPADLLPLAAAP